MARNVHRPRDGRQNFQKLRDGEVEPFKVDSAAFRWRIDDFQTIIDETGRIHMEVCCAW